MNPIDLRVVLFALRDQIVDPVQLAQAALSWSPTNGPLSQHLRDHGVLNDEQLRRLMESLDDTPVEISDRSISTLTHQSVVVDAATTSQSTKRDSSSVVLGDHDETLLFTGNADPTPNHMNPPTGGRYVPISFHRKGGLGQVWLARDTLLGREVALKSIRPDRYDSPNAVGMFTNEAQLTSCLEHPCIVPLYDYVPESKGSGPWYVMKFVAGQTLHEATQVYHNRRKAKDTKPLDLVLLLDAFLSVCRAVAFSHDHGVLHRDLKGQNVILGKFGEVFLLDWGLAKQLKLQADGTPNPYLLDPDQPDSVSGTVMGTPAFMCPQVAAGQHATKLSDVYGLGAILYLILTGYSPAQNTVPQNVFQQLVPHDPPHPQSLNPGVSTALAAICLKALSYKPEDRYSSASDLATDVRNWLADEPVVAYPDSVTQRAARWANRHRTSVLTTAGVLITALFASLVTVALVWQEQKATAAALVQSDKNFDRAEAERTQAEENRNTALLIAKEMASQVTEIETGRATTEVVDGQRREAINKAIHGLERLQVQLPEDTVLRQQLGELHRYAADSARLMNHTKAAEVSYLAAIKIWESLIAEFPDNAAVQSSLAATLYDYAAMQSRLGQLELAGINLDRAERLMTSAQSIGVPDATYARTMGTVLFEWAAVHRLRGEHDQAREKSRLGLKLYQSLQLDHADITQQVLHKILLAAGLKEVAVTHRATNQLTEALTAHAEAIKVIDETKPTPPLERDHRFTQLLVRAERAETVAKLPPQSSPAASILAAIDLEAATTGIEEMEKKYPQTPLYKEWLAATYLTHGEVALANSQFKTADRDLNCAKRLLMDLRQKNMNISDYRYLLARTAFGFYRLYTVTNNRIGMGVWGCRVKSLLGVGKAELFYPDNVLYQQLLKDFNRAGTPRP